MWFYEGKEFTEIPENAYGFVYEITNLTNGKKYIGKKHFHSTRKIPPLKGMKRKRTVVKESDWKSYYGSNPILKEEVKLHRKRKF